MAEIFSNQAELRAQRYLFLASVYLKPISSVLLGELKKTGLISAEEEDETALKKEFNDLFVVPLGKYTTPYEAVYRDEREVAGKKVRGLLMGPSTLDVVRRYRESGADMTKTTKELPDHIGVELAFMEFLCRREVEAREKGEEGELKEVVSAETGFLRDHLVKWVPLLAERIREKSSSDLYKRLVRLTEETVAEDIALLEGSSKPC